MDGKRPFENCWRHYVAHFANTPPPPPSEAKDPYQDYLEALYEQVVYYLDKTVFSLIPKEQGGTPLIDLRSKAVPNAVASCQNFRPKALPLAFFEMAGIAEAVDLPKKNQRVFLSFQAAFEKYDGRLLLLDEPGAGKTTTLMAFARDMIINRMNNIAQPLPVIASIATWDPKKHNSLGTWLAEEIPALKEDIFSLILQGQSLLILDGLDELGDKRTDPDTNIIFQPQDCFTKDIPLINQVVVSCRTKEYCSYREKIALKGAVALEPLSDEQSQNYLTNLPDLWHILHNDEDLHGAVRTSLLLSLFAFAFADQQGKAKEILDLSPEEARAKIFDEYIRKRYEHEARKKHAEIESPLPEFKEMLAKLAACEIKNRFRRSERANLKLYFKQDIKKELDLDQEKADNLIQQFTRLGLMIGQEKIRFAHLLFRNHLALPKLVEQLQTLKPTKGDVFRENDILFKGFDQDITCEKLDIIEAIEITGDVRAIDVLIDFLGDESYTFSSYGNEERVSRFAFDALLSICEVNASIVADLGDKLINFISKAEDVVAKSNAIIMLGRIGDKRVKTIGLSLLSHPHPTVRGLAAGALGLLKAAEAVKKIGRLLSDCETATSSRRITPFFDAYADCTTYIYKRSVSDYAVDALINIGTSEAKQILTEWDPSKQWKGMRVVYPEGYDLPTMVQGDTEGEYADWWELRRSG